jgi:hypothetical protein
MLLPIEFVVHDNSGADLSTPASLFRACVSKRSRRNSTLRDASDGTVAP